VLPSDHYLIPLNNHKLQAISFQDNSLCFNDELIGEVHRFQRRLELLKAGVQQLCSAKAVGVFCFGALIHAGAVSSYFPHKARIRVIRFASGG